MCVKNMLAVFAVFSRRQLAHKAYNNNAIVIKLYLAPKLKIWTFSQYYKISYIPHKGRSSELASMSAIDIGCEKRKQDRRLATKDV